FARISGVGGRVEVLGGGSGGARQKENCTGASMNATDGTSRDNKHVAAFFDIDGTLLAPPSLERQFFAGLRQQRAIPLRNYLLWLAQAFRLMPQGLEAMRHANKMYLRGVSIDDFKESSQRLGQPEMAVPRFLTA